MLGVVNLYDDRIKLKKSAESNFATKSITKTNSTAGFYLTEVPTIAVEK